MMDRANATDAIRWLVQVCPDASDGDWDQLLAMARQTGLSGRLAAQLGGGTDTVLEARLRDHLEAARRIAEKHRRTLTWELHCVARALAPLQVSVVVLKGAAYQARGLPAALGRFSSDIDVMVPRDRLSDVERALTMAGWRTAQPDEYDQRYFREWMHELPPMRHALRNTVLDLHHTILPPTSRFNRGLDPERLFAAAVPLDIPALATLCDEDLVLHSVAHRFTEGEHPFGLRDLIDVHDLVGHFAGQDPAFWVRLVDRAAELGLERPLYYGVRYAHRLLGTAVPADAMARLAPFGPAAGVRWTMDALVPRSFLPGDGPARALSDWLLYCRGHYLRMPWRLLIPHLARKWSGRHRDPAASQPTGTATGPVP